MVSDYCKTGSMDIGAKLLARIYHNQAFLFINQVIALIIVEVPTIECNWMLQVICTHLREYSPNCSLTSIVLNNVFFSKSGYASIGLVIRHFFRYFNAISHCSVQVNLASFFYSWKIGSACLLKLGMNWR